MPDLDDRQFTSEELTFLRELRAVYPKAALKPIKSLSSGHRYIRDGKVLLEDVFERHEFGRIVNWNAVCERNESPMRSLSIFDILMEEKRRRELPNDNALMPDGDEPMPDAPGSVQDAVVPPSLEVSVLYLYRP